MGHKFSHTINSKNSTKRQRQEQSLSPFYLACRNGDVETVKNILPSLSIEKLNCYESNGSTALHAASYYGHAEIVGLLLDAGACRFLRNHQYNLTPYGEAHNNDIRRLLSRVNFTSQARFNGLSAITEWSLDTSHAAEWKIHLSTLLQPELSFQEIILFLQNNYLKDYVKLPSRDFEKILWLFRRAYNENDAICIVQAYTSATQFYAIVNNHLAQYLLKCFRFENEQSTIEKCVAHLASIFIHRPELRSMTFTGTVYRGLLLLQSDLETYTEDKYLLNKSFLSTSKERSIASIYAGIGDRTKMRTTAEKTPLQYTALCIYKIKNENTAIDISNISEIPFDNEVLIMPLCAFQVKSVRKNDEDNNDIQIEIVLEECYQSINLERKNSQQKTRPRVT